MIELIKQNLKGSGDKVCFVLRDVSAANRDDSYGFVSEQKTYAQISNDVDELRLQLATLPRDGCVAVHLDHSALLIATIFCLLELRRAFILIDAKTKRDELAVILSDVKPLAVLTGVTENIYDSFSRSVSQIKLNSGVCLNFYKLDEFFDGYHEICYVIRTSGSTGNPKYVRVTLGCIETNVTFLRKLFDVTSSDVIYFGTPFSFDPCYIELLLALTSGATLLSVTQNVKTSPSVLLSNLFQCPSTTLIQMCPSVFLRWSTNEINFILNHSGLRFLALGGEAFPTILTNVKKSDSLRMFNLYGITEMSVWASAAEITNDEITLGTVMSDTFFELRNYNGDVISLTDEQTEAEGILFIGSNTRICYLNDETNVKIPIVRSSGDNVLIRKNTSGALTYVYQGRTGDVIKRFGHRVNLHVIEKEIQNALGLTVKCVWHENLLIAFLLIKRDSQSDKTSDKMSDKMSDKTSDEMSDKTSDEMSDKTSDKMSDKTSDKMSDKISDKMSDKVSDRTSDSYSVSHRQKIIDRVKVKLMKELNELFQPDIIEVMTSFPLTSNGKIDVRTLIENQFRKRNDKRVKSETCITGGISSKCFKSHKCETCVKNGTSGIFIDDSIKSDKTVKEKKFVKGDKSEKRGKNIKELRTVKFVKKSKTVNSLKTFNSLKMFKSSKLSTLSKVGKRNESPKTHATLTSPKSFKIRDASKSNINNLLATFTTMWCRYLNVTVAQAERHKTSTFTEMGGTSIKRMLFVNEFDTFVQSGALNVRNLLDTSYGDACQILRMTHTDKNITIDETPNLSVNFQFYWKYNLKACVDTTPTLITKNGIDFLAIGNFSNEFVILNAETGKKHSGCYLPDVIENGCVISTEMDAVYVGCFDGCMYSLDFDTCSVNWRFETSDRIKNVPVLTGEFREKLVFGGYDKFVYSVSSQSGQLLWKTFTGEGITSSPMCIEGKIYFGGIKGGIYSLDESNGTIVSKHTASYPIFGNPKRTLHGLIFVDVFGFFYHFSLNNQLLWVYKPDVQTNIYSSCLVFNAFILYGSQDGCFNALRYNETDCIKVSSIKFPGSINSTPVLINTCNIKCTSDESVDETLTRNEPVDERSTGFNRNDIPEGEISETRITSQFENVNRINESLCENKIKPVNRVESTGFNIEDKINVQINSRVVLKDKCKVELNESTAEHESILKLSDETNAKEIIFVTTNGHLYSCNFENDTFIVTGSFKLTNEVFSSPVVLKDKIYLGCRDNHVYCIRIKRNL